MYRIAIIALITPALAAAQEKPDALTPADVTKLIDQLDSKIFREREQASRKLSALDDVPDALDAATRSTSPEKARRATLIVEQILSRNQEKRLQRDLAKLNEMGIDVFLDRMVLTKDFATNQRWKNAADLAEAIAMNANKLGYAGCVVPKANWAGLPLVTDGIQRTVRLSRVLIDGLNNRASIWDCLLISSASMSRVTTVRNSILFVDGDFDGASTLLNSILVCTGNVGSITSTTNSIIVTTGKFGATNMSRNCFV